MEKWVGKTISENEAKERSGIEKVAFREDFFPTFIKAWYQVI